MRYQPTDPNGSNVTSAFSMAPVCVTKAPQFGRVRSSLLLTSTLVVSMLCTGVAVAEDADPVQLVLDMSAAIRTLNYEGRFVHIREDSIDAMSIVHAYTDKGEQERMLSLVGDAREVIRNDSLVTCIWPGSQSVVVSKSKPRNLLSAIDASLVDNSMYSIQLKNGDRVAGIKTHVVDVMPTDSMRYGYRFWIDQDTRMMLRSTLLDMNDEVVEQVMFTSISYPDSIDTKRFEFDEKGSTLTTLLEKDLPDVLPDSTPDKVHFQGLPSGYAEINEAFRKMDISDDPVSHVMVSDGMASVSVYVEYVPDNQQQAQTMGHSSMGAMNAYGHSLKTAFVTVVGEVPKETVKAIALAVRLSE